MKKILIVLIIMLITVVSTYAQDSTQPDIQNEKKKNKPSITFIELGSVKCIPCKMMQPIMKEIEKEYPEIVEVIFHDVRTEEGKKYGKEFKVKLIPTQVFLDKNGKEFFRHEGFFGKEEIVTLIEKQLKGEKWNNK